jgi:hypothetical protein
VEFRDHSIVEEILVLAVENGITFVSTAPYYADGKGSQLEFLVPFADFLDKTEELIHDELFSSTGIYFCFIDKRVCCLHISSGGDKRLAFAYIDADDAKPPFLESILSAPDIDGLSVGLHWKFVELEKGRFDWSKLDYSVKEAAKHKRLVSISFIGSPKTPNWLVNEKIQFFTSASLSRGIVIAPVPWDAAYLALYNKFLAAALTHLQ